LRAAELTIRRADPNDAAALADIHVSALPDAWTAAELARWLTMPAVLALAARRQDGLDGFVLAQVAADEAEILTFSVRPVARRLGIGKSLLMDIFAELAGKRAGTIYIEVAADNHAALAFYRNAGFAVISRRPGYYVQAGEAPVDALVMSKALSGD
jgi:ribosomal-protein-alanine N-acetyltransferase